MARHAAPQTPTSHRALLRAGLTLTVAGLALGAASATAGAAPVDSSRAGGSTPVGDLDPQAAGRALSAGARKVATPATDLPLNPLAKTGVNPLDNSVGTQVADFKPVSTTMVTGPLAQGDSVRDLPVTGPAAGMLTG